MSFGSYQIRSPLSAKFIERASSALMPGYCLQPYGSAKKKRGQKLPPEKVTGPAGSSDSPAPALPGRT